MKKLNKKLLWVDDQINHFKAYVNELKKEGFEVAIAQNEEEAISHAEKNKFDIILVDLKMPKPDGISIIKKIHKIELQTNALLGIFSSYLYLKKYLDRVASLGFDVETIDKDFPPIKSPDFRARFIAPIVNLSEHGISKTVSSRNQLQHIKGKDPFSIDINEFYMMSMPEKKELLSQAEKIAKKTIEKAFSDGYIWVLLCGSGNNIAAFAEKPKDILTEDEIWEHARHLGSPPYVFFRPLVGIENFEYGCTVDNYPTVTLQIKSSIKGSKDKNEYEVHFDTGCPMSLFSYEVLKEDGIINPTHIIGKVYKRKGFKDDYFASPLKKRCILKSQNGDGTKAVKLFGQIVQDWNGSPFHRECNEKECHYYSANPVDTEDLEHCRFRKAMIGRNLLTDNNLLLELDGKNKKTNLSRRKKWVS